MRDKKRLVRILKLLHKIWKYKSNFRIESSDITIIKDSKEELWHFVINDRLEEKLIKIYLDLRENYAQTIP